MRHVHWFFWGMLLIACGTTTPATGTPTLPPNTAAISGTVTYRERMALPPHALITVGLFDVSLADAAAVPLAETTLQPATQVPVPWTLSFDQAHIDPQHSYAIHVQITVDGRLWFTTTQRYPVLTQGAPQNEVEIVLQRVN